MMQYSSLCFIIGQLIFIPPFLAATKQIFKSNMKVGDYIAFTLISPLFVYLYSMVFYVVLQLVFPAIHDYQLYRTLASYGDVLALAFSFLFAFIYSGRGSRAERHLRFFVYTCFYMISMVFSLTYESPIQALIFSVVVPSISSFLLYKFMVLPLAGIAGSKELFQRTMLVLPIAAEILLVLRFILNVVSYQYPEFSRFDAELLAYMTIFGYIILFLIFVSIRVTTQDIHHIEEINQSRCNLVAANHKINRLTVDVLMALVATIEAKDQYTSGHSLRVAEYSEMIARRLGYSDADALGVRQTALLHDIGKIAVPDANINKEGPLTNEEFMLVMQHPLKGAEILKKIEDMPDLYIGALYHHEHWDGRGYPYGISGERIPEVAWIISVADAYDAMTSDRSYRSALKPADVRKEIENGIGTQFSPVAAKAMLEIIDEKAK